MTSRQKIRDEIQTRVRERGKGKTICPSEVARALESGEEWRSLMPGVRKVAAELAKEGEIIVTQKGKGADAEKASGPIRLGLPNV